MAVIKWTALVTAMKGKLRGSVLQMGAGGQIVRSNRQINQSGNIRWNQSKVNIASCVYQWRGLTSAQRATWAAATVNFPTTDRYGGTHYPSPYTLFMRLNAPLNYHLNAPIASAPSPQTFSNLGTVSASVDPVTPQILIYWTNLYTAPQYMVVAATVGMSQGRRPPKGYASTINIYSNYSSLSQDVTSDYQNRFGTINSGVVTFFQIKLLHPTSGQLTPAYVTSAYS